MDLRRVDLNLLVAFDMLMTERSVTRAAQRLSIGQSSMSATLARLRKLFDDPILVRDGKGSAPTPLAESLAAPVRELLTGVETLLAQQDSFDPATATRAFSLIANDHITMTFLQPFIARLSTDPSPRPTHTQNAVHHRDHGVDDAHRTRRRTPLASQRPGPTCPKRTQRRHELPERGLHSPAT